MHLETAETLVEVFDDEGFARLGHAQDCRSTHCIASRAAIPGTDSVPGRDGPLHGRTESRGAHVYMKRRCIVDLSAQQGNLTPRCEMDIQRLNDDIRAKGSRSAVTAARGNGSVSKASLNLQRAATSQAHEAFALRKASLEEKARLALTEHDEDVSSRTLRRLARTPKPMGEYRRGHPSKRSGRVAELHQGASDAFVRRLPVSDCEVHRLVAFGHAPTLFQGVAPVSL